jgi:hypothetical protein
MRIQRKGGRVIEKVSSITDVGHGKLTLKQRRGGGIIKKLSAFLRDIKSIEIGDIALISTEEGLTES